MAPTEDYFFYNFPAESLGPLRSLCLSQKFISLVHSAIYPKIDDPPDRVTMNERNLSLCHNCDSTTIRLRYDEKLTCSFFACVELEAVARDTL